MTQKPIFFLFLLILISFPIGQAFASTGVTAQIFGSGEAGFDDDQIVLDNDSTVDLSYAVDEVTETTEIIGGVKVSLTLEVEMGASGDKVVLTNTQLPTVEVQILNGTIISAPANWNKELAPPKLITTSGNVPTNFQTPKTSIQVGSPDVILVFDKVVSIVLESTTGQTAYKTPGSSTWILIKGCSGTYAAPNDPPANGECSISNGIDTKILTFHFTEFSGLSVTPTLAAAPETSTGKSGGHGRTGVGPSSGGGYISQSSSNGIPAWFDNVFDWYREGKITPKEFFNAYSWIVENLLK